jgi:hypothetical protein
MTYKITITNDFLYITTATESTIVSLGSPSTQKELKDVLSNFHDNCIFFIPSPSNGMLAEYEYKELSISDFIRDMIDSKFPHPALKLWAISIIMEA